MTEAVAFDDAVALGVSYLRATFSSRSETATVAEKFRAGRHVRVMDGGGVRHNLVQDAPRLTFRCYAPTGEEAKGLHRLTRAVIGALEGETVGGVFVAQVLEVGNPGERTDPNTNLPYAEFTVELLIGGDPI